MDRYDYGAVLTLLATVLQKVGCSQRHNDLKHPIDEIAEYPTRVGP